MPNLTLEDIAKIAGVSRSTVSRVVNGQSNVKEETRQRIQSVIEETGFSPNVAARTLVSQRSDTIGLVLPNSVSAFFTDPYYSHLIKGISQACNQFDYTLALFLAATTEDQEKLLPRVTRKGSLDGVIIQSGHHGDQAIIAEISNTDLPVLVAGRPMFAENISYIDIDNVAAAKKAVAHLISLGHNRIATITGPLESAVGVDRLDGYHQALDEAGINVEEAFIVSSDFTENGGYQSMKEIVALQPDAVFAASDTMTIGAIRAVREAGLEVPQDIAFVGFDDLPVPMASKLNLTTIRQPVVEFGFKAVETLVEMINHPSHGVKRVEMETELIIRESCGARMLDPTRV